MAGWWFGTMDLYDFPYIGNGTMIPTDELIFFKMVIAPPTRFHFPNLNVAFHR